MAPALTGSLNIPCIIDFHVHMPNQLSSNRSLDPQENARILIEEMNNNNICKIVLLALETSPEIFRREVNKNKLYKGLEDLIAEGYLSLPGYLAKLFEDPFEFLEEHVRLLNIAHTPSEIVVNLSKNYGNGRILAAIAPELNARKDLVLERTERLLKEGAIGVKVLPTISFIKDKHMNLLDSIAEIVEDNNGVLIIHTGCDPGIWELPFFCRNARPTLFEWIPRKHKDLIVILAHSGAYSALKPGIFMHEAIEIMRRYDNVYGDTAALDRDTVEYLVLHVGANKILFGSDYPVVVGLSWRMLILDILESKLSIKEKEKILYYNAREILAMLNRHEPSCNEIAARVKNIIT